MPSRTTYFTASFLSTLGDDELAEKIAYTERQQAQAVLEAGYPDRLKSVAYIEATCKLVELSDEKRRRWRRDLAKACGMEHTLDARCA